MDDKLFSARVNDVLCLCQKTNKPRFLGFLTTSERAAAESILKNSGCNYAFFGGYDKAERAILSVYPEWCENVLYPVCALTFSYKKEYRLTHRDFLGALMSLGIERDTVGDILVGVGRAVVFIKPEVAEYCSNEISKVGNVGVVITGGFKEPLPEMDNCVMVTGTVASCRLDCIVSELLSLSRKGAVQKIEAGLCSVNGICRIKTSVTVKNGDRITVKGGGRFDIISLDGVSKKGRTIMIYSKFV